MSKYDDMLDLPHHVSETRPRMSLHDRAAQFSPFAALVGYHAAIDETARTVEARKELAEDLRLELNEKLLYLRERLEDGETPEVALTWFQRDHAKDGGAYVTRSGTVKRLELYSGAVDLTDGTSVSFEDLIDVELL